jgi:predicted hydrocarbon binding protein
MEFKISRSSTCKTENVKNIKNLKELIEFMKEEGGLIILKEINGNLEIEIYDDYRE